MSKIKRLIEAYKEGEHSTEYLLAEIGRILAGQAPDSIAAIAEELDGYSLSPEVATAITGQLALAAQARTASELARPAIVNDETIVIQSTTAAQPYPLQTKIQRTAEEGDTLNDRFELIKLVGSGGMSKVYKALDRHKLKMDGEDPYVAVKVLSRRFSNDPRWFSALQQEANNSQRLIHKNIVKVYDFYRDGPTVYIAMEYLFGEPLTWRIRSPDFRGMPSQQALEIINAMGNALSFAHDQGIVHCDFKPANVFLTNSGEVKLIDFGIARVIGEAMDESSMGTSGFAAVSPVYASPDIVETNEPPTPHDDVFSLACTAYELLTSTHPFDHLPSTEARNAGLQVEHRAGLTGHQWQAFKKALVFDRGTRTPSVARFLEDLNTSRWQPVKVAAISAVAATVFALVFGVMLTGKDQSRDPAKPPGDEDVAIAETPSANEVTEDISGVLPADDNEVDLAPAETTSAPTEVAEELTASRTTDVVPPILEENMVSVDQTEPEDLAEPKSAFRDQSQPSPETRDSEIPRTREATDTAEETTQIERITALMALAEDQIAAKQLTTPPGDAAFDTYQQVLELVPEHPGARDGIEAIKAKYKLWAYVARRDGDWRIAQSNLKKAIRIDPRDRTMRQALDDLNNAERRADEEWVVIAPDDNHRSVPAETGGRAEPTPPAIPEENIAMDQANLADVEEPAQASDVQSRQPPEITDSEAPEATHEPTETVEETIRTERITALMALAENQITAKQLTTPPGDAAFDTYQQVLELVPGHPGALDGIKAIKAKYKLWADVARRDGDWRIAQSNLEKAIRIDPADGSLKQALEDLKRAKRRAEEEEAATIAAQQEETNIAPEQPPSSTSGRQAAP